MSDLLRQFRAAIEQFQHLRVNAVNFFAPFGKLIGVWCSFCVAWFAHI